MISCFCRIKCVAFHGTHQKSAFSVRPQLIVLAGESRARLSVARCHRSWTCQSTNIIGWSESRACLPAIINGQRALSPTGLRSIVSSDIGEDDKQDDPLGADTSSITTFLSKIRYSVYNDILPLVRGQESVVMIVGISGGCDSVGLLHVLMQLGLQDYGIELHAVHFDHQQRGIESDGDTYFVTKLCETLKVPLHTYYWSEKYDDKGKQTGSFSQDTARIWRRSTMYDLLQSLTVENERGLLVTAHHKDDSAETLLLKLLRGVYITNLVGMEAVVEPEDMPLAIWARPLLGVTKIDIEHYLTTQSLKWREDSSNVSSKYKRNRVRNELIPLLQDIVGGEGLLEKRLTNLSQQSQELKVDLALRAQKHLEQSESGQLFLLSGQSMTLVEKEALHLWTKQRGATLSYEQLQRVCRQIESYPGKIQWALQVGDQWSIIRKGSSLDCMHETGFKREAIDDTTSIEWCLVEGEPEANKDNQLTIRLDQVLADHVDSFRRSVSGSVIRAPFTPSWKNKPIKVNEFLRGQKVPLHLRDQVPTIVMNDNIVVALFIKEHWEVDVAFQPNAGDKDSNGAEIRLTC